MNETAQQRLAIDARGKTIVSASAGSGKTHVMIERVLSVLEEGGHISEMLAVTFTNKAAAQMRERLRSSLLERVSLSSGEERERFLRELSDLPLADVCTIHAFCGRLIRTFFYLVDVDPRFRIIGTDDAERLALSRRAIGDVFEEAYAEGKESFRALLAAFFRKKKDARLRELIVSLADTLKGQPDFDELLDRVEGGGELETLFDRACELIAEDARRRAAEIERRANLLSESLSRAAPKGFALQEGIVSSAKALQNAADLFEMGGLTHSVPRCPNKSKDVPENVWALGCLQSLSKELGDLYKSLKYSSRDEELAKCRAAGELSSAAAGLVRRYEERLAALKREAGVLDYGDLERLALAILSDPEAGAAIRAKYRYLFVDEYQDVNPLQERILGRLGEDVFLVGDEKQAIYGFRGSRSEYFRRKMTEFGAGALGLDTNFRSADGVLASVNEVFSAALEGYVPMRGSGLFGEYVGETVVRTLPASDDPPAPEGVYSVTDPVCAEEDPVVREVVRLVEEECGRREGLGKTRYDCKAKKEVPVRYGDVAILVRKNTKEAGPIVRALSDRGIPVTSASAVNICDFFEVRLLVDWLSFLDDPEQDVPLASAMLSAIGGFTERELALIRIRTERTLKKHGLSFRAAVREFCEGLSLDPLSSKIGEFFARAAEYRNLSRVRSASEILARLLADGLEAQICAREAGKGGAEGALSRVARFLKESEGAGDVHAFLNRLGDSDFEIDFSESGGEEAVHVVTMHASKGLEFPVVILTELDCPFHRTERDDVMFSERFLAAARYFDPENRRYEETILRDASAIAERRESVRGEKNLLYVAMTRACSRLYLLAEEREIPAFAPEGYFYSPDRAGRLSDFIPPAVLKRYEGETGESSTAEEDEEVVYRPDPAEVQSILAARGTYPFEEELFLPVKDSATGILSRAKHAAYSASEEDTSDMVPLFDMAEADEKGFDPARGIAYHAFLEHAAFGADAKEELERMRAQELLSPEQLSLLDLTLLQKILSLPALGALAGKRTLREQRFLVRLPASDFPVYGCRSNAEILFQGAIDLLVPGEGEATVYDYKLSALGGERLREKYAPQISLYRKTAAKILGIGEEKVRCFILNIASGELVPMDPSK